MSNATDVVEFIEDLDGGVLKEKLAHMLSDVALGTVLNGDRSRKGKLNLELTFQRVGEHSQVIISHKLSHSTPTTRGKKMEENTTETPMFVAKGGRLSIEQPKEEHDGQYALVHQIDGQRK
ncbi:hypothetical protein [Kistimonas asteriae]|uniref:hypothetical protein n=1 Tax=Kistimonas asteriae TaxID=517724 RepID=UPI001BA5FBB8|nr:hypothetical protein [Kistimonas asteriae]